MVTSGYKGDAIFPAAVCTCRERGKRLLLMVWQTCFCARMRRSIFSFPLPGCRAAVPFGQSPKRHQKRFCSPAPSENTCGIFRRRRISGRGSLVLLMQAGYGRWLFTLILVAVCTCWLEQGITAKVEPRRRNCRRAISLAATEKGEKATFASFCLLTKGRGCRERGKRLLSMVRQTSFCARMRNCSYKK